MVQSFQKLDGEKADSTRKSLGKVPSVSSAREQSCSAESKSRILGICLGMLAPM